MKSFRTPSFVEPPTRIGRGESTPALGGEQEMRLEALRADERRA